MALASEKKSPVVLAKALVCTQHMKTSAIFYGTPIIYQKLNQKILLEDMNREERCNLLIPSCLFVHYKD